jgi:hypothetical protein
MIQVIDLRLQGQLFVFEPNDVLHDQLSGILFKTTLNCVEIDRF